MECTSTSMQHVHLDSNPQGGLTSTPLRHPEEARMRARVNPDVYPPRYDMKAACAGILQTAQTQDEQTKRWIFSHC